MQETTQIQCVLCYQICNLGEKCFIKLQCGDIFCKECLFEKIKNQEHFKCIKCNKIYGNKLIQSLVEQQIASNQVGILQKDEALIGIEKNVLPSQNEIETSKLKNQAKNNQSNI